MNSRITELLKEHNAVLKYSDSLHKNGFNVPINSELNMIIVKSSLSDEEVEQVILHELGHAANDNKVVGSYSNYLAPRYKMESKANDFMLKELLQSYILTTNTEPSDINCVSFLECEKLPLSFEDRVRRILKEVIC